MSLTALQQIMNEIEVRLNNITVANGYNYDVLRVLKQHDIFEAKAFLSDDVPIALFFLENDEQDGEAHCIDRRIATVHVGMFYSGESSDCNNFDEIEQLGADLFIALNRSTTAPLTTDTPSVRLGYLLEKMDMRIKTPLSGQEISPWYGLLTTYNMAYIVDTDNPYLLSPP